MTIQQTSSIIKALLENQFRDFKKEIRNDLAKYDQRSANFLDLIRLIVREELERVVQEKIQESLGKYPTKDEFYTMMDKLMGELQATRQEQTMLSQHDVDQNDRLDRLEDIHPGYTHL